MASWGLQYETGDRDKEVRQKFKDSSFSKCPKCDSTKPFDRKRDVAACRMNGDAYGTDVFTCTSCGWFTSYQWDDASDNYYYD
jgi:hypothetical protein